MPDLNLQDEEGSLDNLESSAGEEAAPTEEEGEAKPKSSALMVIVVVLAVVIVGAGGVYLLNRLGVIKLWGKKAAPDVVQMQQEPTSAEQQAGTAQDTTGVSMIETPPLGVAKKPGGKTTKTAVKPSQPAKEMPVSAGAPKLGEMKGEYTVQVSAWRDKETADEMVKRLEEAGYPAFVEDRPYKDGTWFTVRVGRYGSRKDAQLAVESFALELKSSYWIDRVKSR
jgi:cell division septation protein DedD